MGLQSRGPWEGDRLLTFKAADFRPLDFLHAREGHELLPYEGIYAAALFGTLMIRMGTITGARGGESQQIAQAQSVSNGSKMWGQGGDALDAAPGSQRAERTLQLFHR